MKAEGTKMVETRFFVVPNRVAFTEGELIAYCLAGKYKRLARIKLTTDGIFTRNKPITAYPQFLAAIERSELAAKEEAKRLEIEKAEREKHAA